MRRMWFFFGGSLVAWINSCILRRVFVIFEGSEEDDNTKEGGLVMNFLEERIVKDGIVKEGNVLKV